MTKISNLYALTNQIYVNSSGTAIGIGTTTPSSKLEVAGSVIAHGALTLGSGYAINFYDKGTTAYTWIEGSSYNQSYSFLAFTTGGSEKVRIDSSGNFGIGVAIPSYKLDVNGTARISGAISGTSASFSGSLTSSDALISTDGTNTIRLQKNYFGGIDALYQSGTNAFGIYLGGGAYTAAKLYITNGGNVLINTTTDAGYKLDVNGESRSVNRLTIGSIVALTPSGFGYDPNGYKVLIVGQTGDLIYKSIAFGVDVSGNPSGAFSGWGNEYIWRNTGSFITPNSSNNGYNTLLSWNSSGQLNIPNNVGIGTTAPTGKLHVVLPAFTNEDTDSQQAIFGSGTAGYGVRIGYNSSNNAGYIYSLKPGVAWSDLRFAGRDLVFGGGGSIERMRLLSDGPLVFNTITSVPTYNNSIYSYASNGYMYVQGGTTGLGLAGSGNRNNAIYINTTDNAIYFHTNNTGNKMTITSGGQIQIPGQPAWSVGRSTAQSFSSGSPTTINWDQSSGNDCFIQGGVTLNGSNGRITVPVAGKYVILVSIRTESPGAATGTNLNFRKNGGTILRYYVGTSVNSAGDYMYLETRPVVVNCAANDYLDFYFDSVANNFTISAVTNTVVRFSGYLVG